MKSYTDLEQSKKLAEILPLESADMCWCNNSIKGVNYTDKFSVNLYTVKEMKDVFDTALNGWDKYWKLIPCWSLAALFGLLPNCIEGAEPSLIKTSRNDYRIVYDIDGDEDITSEDYTNPIDACYEMLLKLYELNLL